jgi:hypothetical protein
MISRTMKMLAALVLVLIAVWLLRPREPGRPPNQEELVIEVLRDLLRAQDAYRATRPERGYARSSGLKPGLTANALWCTI